jgi:O-antigen/teichoic acid export membrane protein
MLLFVAGTALLGTPVLTLLFGHKYAPAAIYLVPLAVMQAIRVARVGPAIASMACAETRNPLYSNVVRALSIPAAFVVAHQTGNIFWMIACGIGGEVIAALVSAWLAWRRIGLASGHFLVTLAGALVLMGAIAGVSMLQMPYWLLLPATALFAFAIRDLLFSYRALFR